MSAVWSLSGESRQGGYERRLPSLTQSGHHGSPRRVPFSLDDDCTLVAELEATSSRRSQVVKDRSVKDLLGPVGADSYRQDRRSGAGRYQKEGLEGQA
jgi:hypothetical protein